MECFGFVKNMNVSASTLPRVIAVLLALGGSLWGAFLLGGFGWEALVQFPLAVGYVVTVGYIVRAMSFPPLAVRRAIWAVSLIVHDAWLVWVGIPDLPRAGPNPVILWWALATAASAVALAFEPGNAATEPCNAADSR
jgi:hypothetical protein